MKTENYNLIEEDWIPVLMKDGSYRHVSLGEVFAHGDTIADLSIVAYERISVMRLLICIAMAALDERDLADEAAWRSSRAKIPPAVAAYFAKWHDRFNFYGPHAFMQPDGLSGEYKPISILFLHAANGERGTLFDHQARSQCRVFGDSDIVLALLSYLNFSAGGRHTKCKWCGIVTKDNEVKPSAHDAPSLRILHTLLVAENLADSIWLNMVTLDKIRTLPEKQLGRPLWELQQLTPKEFQDEHSCNTVLSRLVPLSRLIKIDTTTGKLTLGLGPEYKKLPSARDIFGTVKMLDIKGSQQVNYLEVDEGTDVDNSKSVWRSFGSILLNNAKSSICGALTLSHLSSPANVGLFPNSCFSIWCGGLMGKSGKNKPILPLEWNYTLPVEFLENHRLKSYQAGIGVSELFEFKIERAVQKYVGLTDNSFIKDCENPKPKDALKQVIKRYSLSARKFFWDALEKEQPKLVHIVCDDGDMADWDRIVAETARKAFERACPHQTGRQIAAYVQALDKLSFKKKEDEKK